MELATFLPHQATPYFVALIVGFIVGAWGQAAGSRVVALIGIVIVLVSVFAFEFASSSGAPTPPGF